MCCLEDFGVDVTIAAADKVACRCGDSCMRVTASETKQIMRMLEEDDDRAVRRLRRLMAELPDAEGDWVLEATEAGGDVD